MLWIIVIFVKKHLLNLCIHSAGVTGLSPSHRFAFGFFFVIVSGPMELLPTLFVSLHQQIHQTVSGWCLMVLLIHSGLRV